MKVVIAGGTGLIGSALTRRLLEDRHHVIVLSRFPERKSRTIPSDAQIVGWDGRTSAGWLKHIEGAGAIVNLAGEPLPGEGFFPARWTKARKRAIVQSRLDAGQAIVEAVALAKDRPKTLVQASAIGYYGPNPGPGTGVDSPPGGDFLAQTVVQWEASTAPVEQYGVRRVLLRTGIVLDPGSGALRRLLLPFRLFAGGTLGDGTQWMSWIHLEDAAAAIVHLLTESAADGPFHIIAPNPVTQREFSTTLGRVLRRPSWLPIPGLALRLGFGEVSTIVLDGQKLHPVGLLRSGYKFQFPELEGALRDLLSQPEQSLREFTHSFQVDAPVSTVRAFHTGPHGFRALAPPGLPLRIHHASLGPPYGNLDFTMWLGPLPVRWLAHIEWQDANSFRDDQLRGPFERWTHEHAFSQAPDGRTDVADRIRFRVRRHPVWGPIGHLMAVMLPLLFRYRAWVTRRRLARPEGEDRVSA